MKLYLYKIGTAIPVLTIEDVVSYTADQAVTVDGAVYGPFAADCELSTTEDCAGTLRAQWRRDHPAAAERLAAVEAENKLLRAQVSAETDRREFLEDCIAEMAGQIYNV